MSLIKWEATLILHHVGQKPCGTFVGTATIKPLEKV